MAAVSAVSVEPEAAAGKTDSGKDLQEMAAGSQRPGKLGWQHTGDGSVSAHQSDAEVDDGVEPAGCSCGPVGRLVTRKTSHSETLGHQVEEANHQSGPSWEGVQILKLHPSDFQADQEHCCRRKA